MVSLEAIGLGLDKPHTYYPTQSANELLLYLLQGNYGKYPPVEHQNEEVK